MKQSERVQVRKPSSSVHDLSHEKKMTAKMGDLVPILMQETLPGDKFKVKSEMLMRMQPLLAPMMHRVNVYIHYFFVPNRIIWDDWESFITGGKDGTEMPNHPKVKGSYADWITDFPELVANGSLMDYMGVPTNQIVNDAQHQDSELVLSQLPFRAYQRIFNEFYRDPNLGTEPTQLTSSSDIDYDESSDLLALRKRCWEKDYFTASLPTPQRGEDVTLPLGDTAPVNLSLSDTPAANQTAWRYIDGSDITANTTIKTDSDGTTTESPAGFSNDYVAYDPINTLEADLANATSASINDLRRSYALQRWLEKNSRGGYRYFEQLFSHFGVKNPDHRLQRPEYLGGGKMPVKVSEVLQTSETSDTAQGNMAGHGFVAGQNAKFNHYFQEHGIVLGIMSIMPRTAYQDGLPKLFSKFDRFDYYWPEFAHIGEEPLKNKEVLLTGLDEDEETFGYNPRYQDYRFAWDMVHGEMRDSLDFWHLGRKFDFSNKPALNEAFTRCQPDNRIWPITDGSYDHFIVQLYNNVRAIRPVAKFGTPM